MKGAAQVWGPVTATVTISVIHFISITLLKIATINTDTACEADHIISICLHVLLSSQVSSGKLLEAVTVMTCTPSTIQLPSVYRILLGRALDLGYGQSLLLQKGLFLLPMLSLKGRRKSSSRRVRGRRESSKCRLQQWKWKWMMRGWDRNREKEKEQVLTFLQSKYTVDTTIPCHAILSYAMSYHAIP
jgi:hypothetical protein